MGNPRQVRPDEVEVLVARELRKSGLALAAMESRERLPGSDSDRAEYGVVLVGTAHVGLTERTVLVEFRNEASPVSAATVQAFAAREVPVAQDAPRRLLRPAPAPLAPADAPMRVLMSTVGFDPAAVRDAQALGIALFRIADGGAAFLRSQWAMGDQPPAWVPEYMAETVGLTPTGDVRYG